MYMILRSGEIVIKNYLGKRSFKVESDDSMLKSLHFKNNYGFRYQLLKEISDNFQIPLYSTLGIDIMTYFTHR